MTAHEKPSARPSRPLSRPPITPQLRAEARAHPGQQVYVIDPEYDPDGAVPGWAIRGFYPVTPAGEIDQTGWVGNPDYRPGPLTLGWPQPRNPVDRAVQLVAARHQPIDLLVAVLAQAEVVIPTSPEHPEQIPVVAGADGADTLKVFTAPDCLGATTARVVLPTARLVPLLRHVVVAINPDLTPSIRVAGTAIADAVTAGPTASPPPSPPRRPSSPGEMPPS